MSRDACLGDGIDKSLRWPFRPGRSLSDTREEAAVFPFLERVVKLEQCGWTDSDGVFNDPCGLDDEAAQAQENSVPCLQIGRSATGSIQDEQLMLHQ